MSYDVYVSFSAPVKVLRNEEPPVGRALSAFLARAEGSTYSETRTVQVVRRATNEPQRYLMTGDQGVMFAWAGTFNYFLDRDEEVPRGELQAVAELVRVLVGEGLMLPWHRALIAFQAADSQVGTVIRVGVKVDGNDEPLPGMPIGVRVATLPFGWGSPEEVDGPDEMMFT